jgi:hypothetical protein
MWIFPAPSVAIASFLGIVGIVGDGFGTLAVHALLTALVVAGGSVLALGCVGAWELPSARVASRLGVFASCAAMAVMIAGVWLEPNGDAFWRLAGSLSLVAIAATHASMMWLARLAPRVQWLRSTALIVDVLLVAMTLAAIWEVTRGGPTAEALAILGIVEGGLTLAITAMSAASRGAQAGAPVAEVCFCPRCGKRLWLPAGEIRCHHCDEVFFVELRPSSELPSATLRA